MQNQDSPPACPSCNAILRKKPARKTKCPFCGKSIFVRSTQKIFPSILLTEDDARAADWVGKLEMFGVDDSLFFLKRKELSEKFNSQAKSSDVIWGLFNDLLFKNGNDE